MEQTSTPNLSKASRFFNTIDNIDRYLYGRKMKNFLWGSILVLLIAPFLDELLEVPHDRLTYLSTLLFFMYVLVIFLAWISAWRDDQGKWTLARTKSRLVTYYQTFRDTAAETKTKSRDELLYRLGGFLFLGAIGWKACQNLSVFIRKPMESISHRYIMRLRNFERITNHWYWIALLVGLGIMIYLYKSNPQILKRIKNDLKELFGRSKTGYHNNEAIKFQTGNQENLIVASKRDDHLNALTSSNRSILFNEFVTSMKSWTPINCRYEYEYQDKLYRHLKRTMPEATIELEYPIGHSSTGNKGRADIVINDTILIEMKREYSAGSVQRAKGQILQYSDIWKNRGPVILLLCNYEYEQAKLTFAPTMIDLNKLERSVLTIVAEN